MVLSRRFISPCLWYNLLDTESLGHEGSSTVPCHEDLHKTKNNVQLPHRGKPDKVLQLAKVKHKVMEWDALSLHFNVTTEEWGATFYQQSQLQQVMKRYENNQSCNSFQLPNNCSSLLECKDSIVPITWQLTSWGCSVIEFLISNLGAWSFVAQLLLFTKWNKVTFLGHLYKLLLRKVIPLKTNQLYNIEVSIEAIHTVCSI